MTVDDLLIECTARGIILQAQAGRLEIDAPPGGLAPDLLDRLRAAKPELLEILRTGDSGDGDTTTPTPAESGVVSPATPSSDDPAGWREFIDAEGRTVLERIDPPEPCEGCGGITRWQDAIGRLRCPDCDPARADGARVQARARAIRRRHPIPTGTRQPQAAIRPDWPPENRPGIIATPIPTCGGCNQRLVVQGQPGRPAGLCFDCWTRQAQETPKQHPATLQPPDLIRWGCGAVSVTSSNMETTR